MADGSTHPFWAGTRACVLGGTGFLGRHIVGQLLAAGATVRTVSLPGVELGYTHSRLETRCGDVTDPAVVSDAVAGTRVVFLAAGPVGVGRARPKR